MNKKLISAVGVVIAAAPLIALAAPGELTGVTDFINALLNFANNTLVPALFAIIFLVFAWSMYKVFVAGKGNAEARTEGVNMAINSIIGIVLILSFWGIVNLLNRGFGLDTQSTEIRTPGIRTNPTIPTTVPR